MANFGWAYVDCADKAGQAAGPTGSIQFLTGTNATSGSEFLTYHTSSGPDYRGRTYARSTLILSGNLRVTGSIIANTVSASQFHYQDITVIDVTGSTKFGNSNDDTHMRTGSLVVGAAGSSSPTLSASVTNEVVHVKGFAGGFLIINTSPFTLLQNHHIFGVTRTSATVINVPAANTVPAGLVWTIKDQVTSRTGAGNNITLTSSSPIQQTIDGQETYVLTGSMPAINLYTNGINWFVF